MADEKKKVDVEEELQGQPTLTVEQVVEAMRRTMSPTRTEREKRKREEFEEPFPVSKDKLFGMRISMDQLQRLDGIPGYMDIEDEPRRTTAQGLPAGFRYETSVIIDYTGTGIYQYGIVDKKAWLEEKAKAQAGTLLGDGANISQLQMRAAD